jgi:hypothetical protein
MKNTRIKSLISRLLTISLILTLAYGVAPVPMRVQAATASWKMTSQKVGVCIGYPNGSNSFSHDMITGNGGTALTTESVSADSTQKRKLAYLGNNKGWVRFMEAGGYIYGSSPSTSDNYSECTVPVGEYSAGAVVTLKIHTWTEHMVGSGMSTERKAYIGISGAGHSGSHGEALQDANGKTSFNQNSTNPNTSKWFIPIKGEATITVTGTMPKNPKEGDTCSIYYMTDGGQYEWIYTYQVSQSPKTVTVKTPAKNTTTVKTPAKNTTTVKTPGKVKILSVKKKTKKIYIVKYSLKGKADGLQLRSATNKKFRKVRDQNVKINKKKRFKVTDDTPNTYYFKVRAFNTRKDGSKVYGKWSKTRKIKIK